MNWSQSRTPSKINQQRLSQSSSFKLRFKRSRIHRSGVFAGENIPARRRIIEYSGEKISRRESRRRYLRGWGSDPNLDYLAQLDSYWAIDGSAGGSGAELINHSCAPNAVLRKVGERLFLFSLRKIRAGEELTYDYQFPRRGDPVECRCGSSKCRGTINLR
jgi:SET domain-containing protein